MRKIKIIIKKKKKKNGDAGYRSPCPSHAKRMLYHLSYTPIQTIEGEKRQDVESIRGKEKK